MAFAVVNGDSANAIKINVSPSLFVPTSGFLVLNPFERKSTAVPVPSGSESFASKKVLAGLYGFLEESTMYQPPALAVFFLMRRVGLNPQFEPIYTFKIFWKIGK